KVFGPLAVIAGAGKAFTVIVFVAVAAPPLASALALHDALPILTTIDCVVAVVDQTYPAPPEAVSVTLSPEQKVVGPPAVIAGAGKAVTITVFDAVAEQPLASVTATE